MPGGNASLGSGHAWTSSKVKPPSRAYVKWAEENDQRLGRNEAETRFHLIDGLFVDCLGWPREQIKVEHYEDGTFSDYEFGVPFARLTRRGSETRGQLLLAARRLDGASLQPANRGRRRRRNRSRNWAGSVVCAQGGEVPLAVVCARGTRSRLGPEQRRQLCQTSATSRSRTTTSLPLATSST